MKQPYLLLTTALLFLATTVKAQVVKYEHEKHHSQIEPLFADSLQQLEEFVAQKNQQAALRISRNMLAGRLGNFYGVWNTCDRKLAVYYQQSLAYEQLGDYNRAVASLDTALNRFASDCREYFKTGEAHCRRGELKYKYLHDVSGSCYDFRECAKRRLTIPVKVKKSECGFTAKSIARDQERMVINDVFGPIRTTLKLGFVGQRATGAEVGVYVGRGQHFIMTRGYGAGAGTEVLWYQGKTIVAPKLSY